MEFLLMLIIVVLLGVMVSVRQSWRDVHHEKPNAPIIVRGMPQQNASKLPIVISDQTYQSLKMGMIDKYYRNKKRIMSRQEFYELRRSP